MNSSGVPAAQRLGHTFNFCEHNQHHHISMAKFKKSARNGSRKAGGVKLKMAKSMKSTKSAAKPAAKPSKLFGASQIEWKQHTQNGKQIGKDQDRNSKSRTHTQRQHTEPTIPFEVDDKILLVGEGETNQFSHEA
jgi:hypothetical protein